jgi:hypothetical protein
MFLSKERIKSKILTKVKDRFCLLMHVLNYLSPSPVMRYIQAGLVFLVRYSGASI